MPRTRTKLCGMMTPEDARAAADAGADAIGMILHANAKRLVSIETAAAIVAVLPPYVMPVGVFVDASASVVIDFAVKLDLTTVQFHGEESAADIAAVAPLKVIKSLKVSAGTVRADIANLKEAFGSRSCPNLCGILLESAVAGAAGGTGVENDFDFIRQLMADGVFDGLPPVIVSGGLSPGNVGGVVRLMSPYAVDVSSGIESSFGKKSVEKMEAFITNASSATPAGG